MFGFLMFFEDFARPLRYRSRYSGQFCDFNAVAAVCCPRLYGPQENDPILCFLNSDVEVFYTRQKVCKLGKFMIMRRKYRFSAEIRLYVLDDGPRNRQAVERGCAAANFIENDEALWGG